MQTNVKISLSYFRDLFQLELDNFGKLIRSGQLNSQKEIEKLVKSLQDQTITADEFIKGDYLQDNRRYYGTDDSDYLETREGDILHRDEAYFCDYFEEYTDETFRVITGNGTAFYCQEAIDDDAYEYNGNYYTAEGLSENNLQLIDGEVYDVNNLYYNEETEEYQIDEPNLYLRGYHTGGGVHFFNFTENPAFYIGYEIEKEDSEVKRSILINDFEESCKNWKKEEDGSLDSYSGYELISPAFELIPDKIRETIQGNSVLLNHINADKSERCGGHINISQAGVTGFELFDKLKGYTPLFYALYYKRVDKMRTKGKSNIDLKAENEKYQAIRIHSNHLEYRIVSAVIDLDNLIWRTELFNLILNNPTDCPKQAYFNFQSVLKSHIEKVYTNCSKFERLNNRLIEYTQQYEGIQLTDNQ